MQLIDGKKIAETIRQGIKEELSLLEGRRPGLAFILVGDHPASLSYVRAKKKACLEVGIISTVVELSNQIAESDLLKEIDKLNANPFIDAILVQLPLPFHLSASKITSHIKPTKDVDGFHPLNMGKLILGDSSGFIPCTPNGIKILLERSHIPVAGKHVVILGRSNIVGKPLAALLMQKSSNATVTVAHSKSENVPELTRSADILIAAIGKPHFITKEMVKRSAVVIDVGINRHGNRLVGDVDFDSVAPITSHITPVPGGVGPMTIAMLLQNTLLSYKIA